MSTWFCSAVTAAALLCATFAPAPAAAAADVKILLVGSSLVRGIKPTVKKLYKAQGLKAKIRGHGPPRWTLERHAGSARTANIIRNNRWDYVLLAQNNIGLINTDLPDVASLHAQIVANGSSAGLLMNWYEPDTDLAVYDWLKGYPGATHGYIPTALALDIPIAPAGWGLRTAVFEGVLTDLWRGRQHLNNLGRYLVGVTVYTTLTKQNPIGAWAPAKFSPDQTAYLQSLVNETVLGNPAQWNITLP